MAVLEVIELTKKYDQGESEVIALDHVSFLVERGEFVAIIGASGSGKSTLMHMIRGIDYPTGGSVMIEGNDITAMNEDELAIFRRRNLGLVLSQLKSNRKRTTAGVLAIAMATTLVTAVMCFVTSGNQMLANFLGSDYGDYAGAYSLIIAVPVLILGFLIAAMSVVVISNIFAASASKRIQEFGILKCVGGTGKQIRESVIYESLWLCVTGIPLGLLSGTLAGYTGVRIAGHFVSDYNELAKSVVMRPFSFSLSFYVSVWTYLSAAVFSFLIVLYSAYKPAKKVGKLTAIQCVRGVTSSIDLKKIDVKDGLSGKIFGCEGAIASKNIKRNQSAYRATIRALALGILLLLMTGGLFDQAKQLEEWMTPDSKEMVVDYCSIRDRVINKDTGRREEKIVAPISSEAYNEITARLSEYGDIYVYGVGSDACTYHAILDQNVPDIFDENAETKVSCVSVDENLYRKLCDRAGASYGSSLLINSYQYNDHGSIRTIKPFEETMTEITMINAAEEKQTFEIGGFLYQEDLTEA